MKNCKNTKGITLISLVVTIIVLIILAGVTISLTLGKNGIFRTAKEAVSQTGRAQAEEEIYLAVVTSRLDQKGEIDKEILKSELQNLGIEIQDLPDDLPYIVEHRNLTFEIDKNGTVTQINGIILNFKDVKLLTLETQQLTYSLTSGVKGNVVWKSLDEKVATVTENGLITAVGDSGSTTIIASIEGTDYSAMCNVKVVAKLKSITISAQRKELEIGNTEQLIVNAEPSDIETEEIEFISSDTDIATVDQNGKVTGKSIGQVTITARGKKSKVQGTYQLNIIEKLEFNINVTNVTDTTWQQNVSLISGSLDGYDVIYNISTTERDNLLFKTTNTQVTGKEDGTTYYVWAIATKDGIDVKSSNYIEVKTSHKHSGDITLGTGCYGGKNKISAVIYCEGSWGKPYTATASFTCSICGKSYRSGDKTFVNSNNNIHISCLECSDTSKSFTSSITSYFRGCLSCYNSMATITGPSGKTYENAIICERGYLVNYGNGKVWDDIDLRGKCEHNTDILEGKGKCEKEERESSTISIEY